MQKEVKKVLIISDTHGDFEIIKIIKDIENPDYIIHAGDHGLSSDELNEINMYYVCGNNDLIGDVYKVFEIDKIKFCLCHSHTIPLKNRKLEDSIYDFFKTNKPNIIVYGHTHLEQISQKNGIFIINPGSLMYPRNKKTKKSYIMLYIYKKHHFDVNIKYLN